MSAGRAFENSLAKLFAVVGDCGLWADIAGGLRLGEFIALGLLVELYFRLVGVVLQKLGSFIEAHAARRAEFIVHIPRAGDVFGHFIVFISHSEIWFERAG